MRYRLWEQPTEAVESLEQPTNDWMQESWLTTLEYLKRRDGVLPQASTPEELERVYGKDAGLVHANYVNAQKHMHERNGRQKRRGGVRLTDEMVIPDSRAQSDMHLVEIRDQIEAVLRTRPEIASFIEVWNRRDSGETISARERKMVSRLRTNTGYALTIR